MASVAGGRGRRRTEHKLTVTAIVCRPCRPPSDALQTRNARAAGPLNVVPSKKHHIYNGRVLGDRFPDVFTSPLTPKKEEATALLHRHEGDATRAEQHFTSKLAAAFGESRRVLTPGGVIAVMFAHQSTEAWTSLVHSLFKAGLNITATYPIQTVRANRPRELNSSALASSITVICRPRVAVESALFKDVKKEIEQVVGESVHRFWGYGFRGADLIVACYGPAVGVFGQYKNVEKQGEAVTVPVLLQLVRKSALEAIAGEFSGDAMTGLYFVWANLYGVGEQAFDDMRLVVQVGGDAEEAMDVARGQGLFVVTGPTCRLAVLADRAERHHLGADKTDPLIDQLHRAMLYWKAETRPGLVQYLQSHDLGDHPGFWRLAQALFKVLPAMLRTGDWSVLCSESGTHWERKSSDVKLPCSAMWNRVCSTGKKNDSGRASASSEVVPLRFCFGCLRIHGIL